MKIKFDQYSQTYRIMPKNYWAASVKQNKLIFDSWDGCTKKLLRNPLLRLRIVLTHLKRRLTDEA
jgi:hypothetical protein